MHSLWEVDIHLCRALSISTMDLVCTANAHKESLIYTGTVAFTELPTGRSILQQGEDTVRFEGAYVEFPSR